MKRLILCLFVWTAFSLFVVGASAADQAKLMRFADMHGDRIVFTFEGDLWLIPADGGTAQRLTNHEGTESFAKFSPDGTKIAFTASYDGGTDIYVMDAAGGTPKRLTFHPGRDFVQEWFPDGEWILFRSVGRNYPSRDFTLWKVSVNGGMPVRLPIDRGGLATISPDGKRIAYNRIAREFATWKRYKGGMAMDIWICWLKDGHFKKITEFKGNDNWPMWIGGDIYYVSDESQTANIFKYTLSEGKTTQVTFHNEYDVKYPSRGSGDFIVYQNGGDLHLLDVKSKESRRVPVLIPTDQGPMRTGRFRVGDYIGAFGLSPSGKRMVCDSRGDIYTIPAEEGTPRCLTPDTSRSREKNPVWSPDGRWVSFFSDRSGEEELYIRDRKGEGEWIRLTSEGKGGFRLPPVWSPDSNHLAFSDKHLDLTLVDVKARTSRVIDSAGVDTGWEDWGIQEYSFSPDSKWVAYTKVVQSQLEAICLYSLEQQKVFPVTDGNRNDCSPSFSPDGKYLYFLSDRTFNPIMGDLDQNHIFLRMTKPYVLILEKGQSSPFKAKECDEAVKADEKKPAEGENGGDKAEEKKGPVCVIDTADFARRIVPAPVAAGNYFRLEAVKGGFIYLSRPELEFLKYQVVTDATASGGELFKFDLESKETTQLMSGIGNYHLSADGKKMIYHSGSTFGVVDAGAKASAGKGKVSLSGVTGMVDRKAEFLQMFDEAWRIERDFFYDAGMHKVNWGAMGKKYRVLVPYCGNRGDLNYLIGEMIGELSAGHTYVWGGDTGYRTDAPRVSVGLLGVDFETDIPAQYKPSPGDFYRIAAILPGDNSDPACRSPFRAPDCGIKEGAYLIAVDGVTVKKGDNVYSLLEGKRSAIVTVTYNSEPSLEGAKTYSFEPIGSEAELRYCRWVEECSARVEAATNGRVAYVHLPDMGQRGLIEFAKVYYSQHYKKGLVIDDRYNGGGFTADMILDRLERKLWSLTIPREGGILRNPENVFHGPMVTVVNQHTGSCGEYFATAFQVKKLGKVVGMRTWGGAVGIEPHQDLVDGGTVTPPQFAPYSPWTKEWYFEGWGVEPDIEVENLPADVLKGNDPQLDKAIEIVLEEMKDYWDELPAPPDYPDKR